MYLSLSYYRSQSYTQSKFVLSYHRRSAGRIHIRAIGTRSKATSYTIPCHSCQRMVGTGIKYFLWVTGFLKQPAHNLSSLAIVISVYFFALLKIPSLIEILIYAASYSMKSFVLIVCPFSRLVFENPDGLRSARTTFQNREEKFFLSEDVRRC